MSQLTIVYIIITAVVATTLYRIITGIYNTFKSKRPSKCMNCYLKETCKTRMGRGNSCNNYQNRHTHNRAIHKHKQRRGKRVPYRKYTGKLYE
jgi:hypothetical protein